MSRSRKDVEAVAGINLDELIAATLREKGLMIPISTKEVARAEAEIGEEVVQLPESLKDPLGFLSRKRGSTLLAFLQRQQIGNDFGKELARVAREGGDISDEIKTAMRRDREDAERKFLNRKDETSK